MRGLVVLPVLMVVMMISGTATGQIDPLFLLKNAFPSPFLSNSALVPLMKSNIDLSLKQLLTSKQYGGQEIQRPGMAKLLAEESNRHWEEGINALKKHLQIGGLVDATFNASFTFQGQSELAGQNTDVSHMTQAYRTTMLNLVKTSRAMVKTLTDYHHWAIQNTNDPSHGDIDVAHFLSELAEKEAEVAHKMAMSYTIYDSISSSGVALDMFDDHL